MKDNKKPIPVLGTLILNGSKWIKNQIDSIDYPVENYIIINNGGGGEMKEELEYITRPTHKYIKNIIISTMPYNIGCAAGWNMVIKSYMKQPYWIISNHDVSFSEGFLEEMNEIAQDNTVGLIHGSRGDFILGSFDLFLIKDWVIQSHGLFDENFYPAYCEDADYIMRLHNNPVKTVKEISKKYYHGGSFNYYETGSNTKKDNPMLTEKLNRINIKNFEYMDKKWGHGWRIVNPFKYPFNIEGLDPRTTSFDLEYCKNKHLG